jgi:hypothetical protein
VPCLRSGGRPTREPRLPRRPVRFEAIQAFVDTVFPAFGIKRPA